MNDFLKNSKLMLLGVVIVAVFFFKLSLSGETISEKNFVGKWQSSRAITPIYLYPNGEWEIKQENGTILQYGVWQYREKAIVWSLKQPNGSILRETNPVVSFTSQEFQIQELDRSVTTFKKWETL